MASKYIRCLGCGNYFEVTKDENSGYCSNECMKGYVRCMVCGNYFEEVDSKEKGAFICSKECAIKYSSGAAGDD